MQSLKHSVTESVSGISQVMLPTPLGHGFDYRVPEGMTVEPGSYVSVSFGSRQLPGVVWGAGGHDLKGKKLKDIAEHYGHLPPMQPNMREFLAWVSAYTMAPVGAVMKMAIPVDAALKAPTSRERPPKPQVAAFSPVELSPEQQKAADTLGRHLKSFHVSLLDGVTGAGKTEVYFDTIARVLQEDAAAQALVLLPEIALSVQWLERFEARFGYKPIVWHSGIGVAARKHAWRSIVNGEARVVVGARSALMLPYDRLKLIVVDEEHDASYKQEDGVMYHARDMAVVRSRIEGIPIILASATPSLETLYNVERGKYAAVHLRNRHAEAKMPDIHLVDMRAAKLDRGDFIAEPLRLALAGTIASGHQAMLFLNRRGYAPLVLCRACGHRFQCPQCTAWLVLHKHLPRLQCHHCDYMIPEPKACPECGAEESLHPCGPGVERIAEEMARVMPQARVAVLASDLQESYAEVQARIHEMEEGKVDVLIGTQMIAKGHHFPKLTLVGIVDADMGLNGGDLRAAERCFQLLHQLSGRAGRSVAHGVVMIQSFNPEHPVMQALSLGERDNFLKLELHSRERGRMPPFARLAAIIVDGANEEAVIEQARALSMTAPRASTLQVLGPAPAPMYQLRGHFRYRLLLRTDPNIRIQAVIEEWLARTRQNASVRIKIDIDPYSFM